jgi:hypothetical protein
VRILFPHGLQALPFLVEREVDQGSGFVPPDELFGKSDALGQRRFAPSAAMAVRGQITGNPGLKDTPGKHLGLIAEFTGQAAGGDLQFGTGLNQLGEDGIAGEKERVSFWMGKDTSSVVLFQERDDPDHRLSDKQLGQLKKKHFLTGQSRQPPRIEGVDKLRGEANFGTGKNLQRQILGSQNGIESGTCRMDIVTLPFVYAVVAMGCGDYRPDPVLGGKTGHCQGIVEMTWSVIYSRKDMTVNINQ